MKKYYSCVFILILLFTVSCKKKEVPALASFRVSGSDFEDVISIDGYLEPLNSVTIACPRYVDGTILSIVEDGVFVNEGDTLCVLEDKSVLEDFQGIQTELFNAEMELEKVKADQAMKYALLEAEVKNNEAETLISNLDSAQLKFNSTNQRQIKELELKMVMIEKNKLQKRFKSLAIIQQSELRGQELQIQMLKSRLETAQKRIDDMTLRAPNAGLVIVATHFITQKKMTVGDPVWSNMSIMVIPANNSMKVKIDASEENFKRIAEKNKVEYTFDAMPDNKAWGNIVKKSPVGRPVKENSKVKIFEIEASVDSFKTLPEPGFTCNCKVILKRIQDTIVVPQVAIFEQDSMKVVYVIKPDGFELRQVQTGLSSPKEIIITRGLKRKELIALSKPEPEFIIKKTIFKQKKKAKSTVEKSNIKKN